MLIFKERVGPNEVATVGEEASGLGEGEEESGRLDCDRLNNSCAAEEGDEGKGVFFTTGFLPSEALLLYV